MILISAKNHLVIKLSDSPQENILPHVPFVNEFIHKARLANCKLSWSI